MFSRVSPALIAFAGSVLMLSALLSALYFTREAGPTLDTSETLIVHCAEAMRIPLTAIAAEFEKEHGQKVELRFGPSQTILANLQLTKTGDLFIPADESFIRMAKNKGLIKDVLNVAQMRAVVIVNPKLDRTIATWDDFLAPSNKIGLANTEITAIGKIIKQQLEADNRWAELEKRQPTYLGNVNEVANSARVGSIDVGIVWDVIAQPHADLKQVKLKELENVTARVQVALTAFSKQEANSLRFARYLRAKDKGALHLKKQGYSDINEGDTMDKRPELVVYAGAMLRPAVEASLIEFEKRENVRITRIYNGCGILVSQMKTGDVPDLYFACDTSFMSMVQDQFKDPASVSNNQLMITTKKGNPKQVYELKDLAKPGLRVGIGHEQQCALGALTKETFLLNKLYTEINKNVKVQSPSGDMLVNQIRTGSLDVVVAYRSNIAPFADELDGIPITGVKCATPSQPIAVSKSSAHPELSRKLMEYLQTADSRARFEKLGFGWEVKAVESK
jgi:molybdate transport system substrate-binding protein